MKIEDLIEQVVNANLLVRRDRPPEKIGMIHMADATLASRRMTSGTVLQVGPGCQGDFFQKERKTIRDMKEGALYRQIDDAQHEGWALSGEPRIIMREEELVLNKYLEVDLLRTTPRIGVRVLFGEFAGASVGLEGVECSSDIIFLSDGDVYAILSDDAIDRPEDALELPLEWMGDTLARPQYLLIERAEMPLKRGAIHVPPGARTHTRATEAVIHDVGAAVRGFAPGERIQLAGQGGKRIPFGTHGERELWAVPPSNVLAKYKEAPPDAVVLGNQGFAAPQALLEDAFSDAALVLDEGDRKGLR